MDPLQSVSQVVQLAHLYQYFGSLDLGITQFLYIVIQVSSCPFQIKLLLHPLMFPF